MPNRFNEPSLDYAAARAFTKAAVLIRLSAMTPRPTQRRRVAGSFVWGEAVIHIVENVGKTEAHILRVVLRGRK